MTTKAKTGRGSVEIDGERLATDTFEFDGETYTLRELSTDEGDEIYDASQEPIDVKDAAKGTKTNFRTQTRMLLARSITEPSTSPDRIGKWGGRKYTTVLRHFNLLNSISEENPTPPAGSAGPTSPDGGESLPQT